MLAIEEKAVMQFTDQIQFTINKHSRSKQTEENTPIQLNNIRRQLDYLPF